MFKQFVKIFPSNDKTYIKNTIFDPQKKWERSRIFVRLKNFLARKNVVINTYDIITKEATDKYVYFDLPYPWSLGNFAVWKLIFLNRDKNILICTEPPVVVPFSYMRVFHLFFTKVYTWNDDLVDNKKYFKTKLPKSSLGIDTKSKKFNEKKFLVLINSNKLPFLPFKLLSAFGKELYSERVKAIEYFEYHIPEKFSLFGLGWNKPKKYILRELMLGFKKYSTYKGVIGNKIEVLSGFKYCICFENLTDVNGYITEKIIDCFMAKCVPIYWGASNIEKYIPKDCFIDFRDFSNYDQLLDFLNSIDEARYDLYIKNIEKLVKNKKFIKDWFEDGFSEFFLHDVLETK